MLGPATIRVLAALISPLAFSEGDETCLLQLSTAVLPNAHDLQKNVATTRSELSRSVLVQTASASSVTPLEGPLNAGVDFWGEVQPSLAPQLAAAAVQARTEMPDLSGASLHPVTPPPISSDAVLPPTTTSQGLVNDNPNWSPQVPQALVPQLAQGMQLVPWADPGTGVPSEVMMAPSVAYPSDVAMRPDFDKVPMVPLVPVAVLADGPPATTTAAATTSTGREQGIEHVAEQAANDVVQPFFIAQALGPDMAAAEAATRAYEAAKAHGSAKATRQAYDAGKSMEVEQAASNAADKAYKAAEAKGMDAQAAQHAAILAYAAAKSAIQVQQSAEATVVSPTVDQSAREASELEYEEKMKEAKQAAIQAARQAFAAAQDANRMNPPESVDQIQQAGTDANLAAKEAYDAKEKAGKEEAKKAADKTYKSVRVAKTQQEAAASLRALASSLDQQPPFTVKGKAQAEDAVSKAGQQAMDFMKSAAKFSDWMTASSKIQEQVEDAATKSQKGYKDALEMGQEDGIAATDAFADEGMKAFAQMGKETQDALKVFLKDGAAVSQPGMGHWEWVAH